MEPFEKQDIIPHHRSDEDQINVVKAEHHSSSVGSQGLFVSLNIMGPAVRHYYRRRPPLTRHTAKVLIRVSVGMFLALLLFFLVVYTIVLVYVDKHFNPPLFKSPSSTNSHRKLKLKGRLALVIDPGGMGKDGDVKYLPSQLTSNHGDESQVWDVGEVISDGKFVENEHHKRETVWNSKWYFSLNVTLPQCKEKSLLRILIASAPENFEHRNAIRLTWCNPSNFPKLSGHIRYCVFLIGQRSGNYNLTMKLSQESDSFHDILFGNYIDSYRNLTIKTIHGISWTVASCPSDYILKTDDDSFVNSGLLHTFLHNHDIKPSNLYVGNVISKKEKLKVIRNPLSRWSVPHIDFPDVYYPPYASGMGYILSADVARMFISESSFLTIIPNEDAFLGFVLNRVRVTVTSSHRFQQSAEGLGLCNYLYVLVVHRVAPSDQEKIHRQALLAPQRCNGSSTTLW